MPKSVRLTNFKGIRSLRFELPEPGTYLLAGTNGVGKTSLLACLLRIKHSSAFANHFFTSQLDTRLDDFRDCKIIYQLDDREVSYARGEERWVPLPRKESGLLGELGYPDVLYIGANADRISPRAEDFNLKKLRNAKASISTAANKIFESTKFSTLKEINVKQGITPAFVLQVHQANSQVRYVSERNLSLGELCILKLLRKLDNCVNGSLVLVDEVELALHPRAQLLLFEHLRSIAAAKGLTIIVSSHSVTLIKTVERNKLIFLERVGDEVRVIRGCFSAYALREVAKGEERLPDTVIYVEDDAAKILVHRLCQLVIGRKYPAGAPPSVQVIPIGGYENVLRFLERSGAMLPETVKRAAVLDLDAQTSIEATVLGGLRAEFNALVNSYAWLTRYLPWTPEVGLTEYINRERQTVLALLRERYMNQQLVIQVIPQELLTLIGADQRNACKTFWRQITNDLSGLIPGKSSSDIMEFLYLTWIEDYFHNNTNASMQLLASCL